MDRDVAADLRRAVDGDAVAVAGLQVPQEALASAAAGIGDLVLTRDAILRVLGDLRKGRISGEEAQRWSSFVKRGYVSGRAGAGPVRPIIIDHDDDESTVDVLGRLDDLGDEIDGTMSDDELDQWISRLSD